MREAVRALRGDPLLAWVMIGGLACSIAVWQLAEVTMRQPRIDPLRGAPSLYTVLLSGQGRRLTMYEDPQLYLLLDTQLALHDADALAKQAPARFARGAPGFVTAAPDGLAPAEMATRFCDATLFELFALRFRYGGPFHAGTDEVVLDAVQNDEWFGGRDSVGQLIRLAGGGTLRVAGVLAREQAMRNYDARLWRIERMFLPLSRYPELTPWPDPVMPSADARAFFTAPDQSGDPVARLWLELPGEARRAYEEKLAAYLAARPPGTAPLVDHARLVPWSEFHSRTGKGEGIYDAFWLVSLLVLAGCAINLVRLWSVRFAARSMELGINRALGASRGSVMAAQLSQAVLIGAAAGAGALVQLAIIVPLFDRIIPAAPMHFFLDARAAASCMLAGPAVAVAAALQPCWQFSRMRPAALLRRR